MFLSPLSQAFVHDFELHVLYSELMLTYIPPRMYTQERVCNGIYKEHMFLILSKGSIYILHKHYELTPYCAGCGTRGVTSLERTEKLACSLPQPEPY